MEKLIKLLTLSKSFSDKEKFLIYKIVENDKSKYENIVKILEKEQEKLKELEKEFKDVVIKEAKEFYEYIQNLEEEEREREKNKFFIEKQNFIKSLKEQEEKEKEKEESILDNLFSDLF